jgi:REP element-mobilizing transposase RayT
MATVPRAYGVVSNMYFVTCRTIAGYRMLRAIPFFNLILASILAKSAEISGVEIHGYVAMLNHVHILVTANPVESEHALYSSDVTPPLTKMMTYFNSNVALKVRLLCNWKSLFWGGRFHAAPVLTHEAAEERLRYILAHGVKEGFVTHPKFFPGLSCLTQLRTFRSVPLTVPKQNFYERKPENGMNKAGKTLRSDSRPFQDGDI